MGNIKVDFYQLSITPTADISNVRAGFRALLSGAAKRVVSDKKGYTRELYGLNERGTAFAGVLRKFRTEDLPAIGSVGKEPKDIALDEDQGIIEQNHFVLYKAHDIVGWQVNLHGNHAARFEKFLSEVWDTDVRLEPIIQPDAVQRLMAGDTELCRIEVTIANPKNPALYKNDDFSRSVLGALGKAGADSLHLQMGVDLRRSPDGRMSDEIKRTLTLLKSLGATTAKAKVFEDGIQHTIDLIADRVSSRQETDSEGRLPAESMYGLIDAAKKECDGAIRDYFGSIQDALA